MNRNIILISVVMMMVLSSQVVWSATTPKTETVSETVCLADGETYSWFDQECANTGTYRYTEFDQFGNDSIYHVLNLTVNTTYYLTKHIPVCGQSSLYYKGKTYTEDTDIVDRFKTKAGCDSIITTEIRFGQEFRQRDTLIIRASDAKPIYWHGKEVKGAGLMTDQYISEQGCDSIYELMVFIEEDNIRLTAATICEADTPYTWRGYSYSEVGVYYKDDTIRYADNRGDSLIYRLYLTINDNPEKTYTINLCPGSTQTYRGKVYKKEGVYFDTIPSITGCDTICKVVVTNLPNTRQVDSIRLKPGQTYTWRDGKTYTYKDAKRDDIFISGTNQYGCDSTYHLIITYMDMYEKNEDVTFCWSQEEPWFMWHDKAYGNDTIVFDTLIISDEAAPDTAYTLNLMVRYPSEPTYLYREICAKGRHVEDFPHIKTEGIHYDTLANQYGCDSVLIINVKYNPQDTTFYERIQYGTRINWYGQELGAEEGVYDHIPENHIVGLCDTLYHLNLKWWYPFARNYYDTICEQRLADGEQYIWRQDEYEIPFRLNKDANGYRDTIFYNRDSSNWLNLHVVKQNIHRDTIHICDGSGYQITWSDGYTRTFTKGGYYRDTFPAIGANRQVCDSIVEYFFVVHKPEYRPTQVVHIPDTATQYVWHIQETGRDIIVPVHKELGYELFKDTVRSTQDIVCDSVIYQLTLITDKTYRFPDEHVTICHPYTWEGHTLNGKPYIVEKAGVYWDSLRTVKTNVDSVYCLVVDTLPHYLIHETREICMGDSIDFFGEWIKTAGTYRHLDYTKEHGCDSITEWTVNLIPVAAPTVITVNRSDQNIPYVWVTRNADGSVKNSRAYQWTGVYRDTVKSSRECDSILVLDLKIWPTYRETETDEVCASLLPYVWHNKQFRHDTVYVDSMKTVMQYDSIVTLHLTVLRADTTYLSHELCYGATYTYNSITYVRGGRYTQRLANQYGCDSIIVLQIRELGRIMTSEEVHVNGSYTWLIPGKPSRTFTNSGIYYDTLQSANGCDSILELKLTVHDKEVIKNFTIQECEDNLPYLWRSVKPIYTDSVLLDTVKSDITDTINVVKFIVLRPTRDTIHPILCEGDYYTYRGIRYTNDTLIHDTAYSELGCVKTIHSIDMKFRKVKVLDIPITTSDEAPYVWTSPSGKVFTVPTKNISTSQAVVTDTVRYTDGKCDSIRYRLILTIGKTYYFSDSVHLCLPDTILWHGQTITAAGTYYDRVQTAGFGYDSIYELRVGAHRDTIIRENYRIPAGSKQIIHGIQITQTGKYTVAYIDHHGCDSIYEFNVNVIHPNVIIDKDTTICEGDYCLFYGGVYTREGNYQYVSQEGDSVVNLALHVNQTDITRMDTVIGSYIAPPYILFNKEYMQAGMYYDTLLNRNHCDSVIVINLIITDRVSDWDQIPLCPGSQIKIDNMVITRPGQYTFLRPSITQALDSLYRVHVYDAPAYDLPTEVREICEGDTVTYGGKQFTKTGQYTMYFKTVHGCDSIMHLDLTVHPLYHHDSILTIPDYNAPVRWFSNTYSESGTYIHREPTQYLCDSSFTLVLTVVPTGRDTANATICNGTTYTWRNKGYTETGIYRDTVWMPDVKQSYIHTLLLDVLQPTLITSAKIEENVCADTEGFDITLTYLGDAPTKYTIRFDEIAKQAGFVDIEDEPFDQSQKAHVRLPQFKNAVYQNHTAYVQPNYYSLRLELDNGICGIERSDSIELLIRYPSWIIEQNWNDIVMPLSAEYNGGYEFIKTEWYVNHVLQPNTGTLYLQSNALVQGDEVMMMATRKGENIAIPSCPIVIKEYSTNAHPTPVIVYPTQAPRQAPIVTIEAEQEGQYEVYASTGMLITRGTMNEGLSQVTLPGNSGIYLIRTMQGEHTQTHKIMIY